MSLNRVTPSPDEERYPLENMEQGYSGTQQNKDEVIIGGMVTNSHKYHIGVK